MNNTVRTDQDYMTDILYSEKQLCKTYTTAATESKTENIRNGIKDILNCELDIQNRVFNTMTQNGWYPTEQAEQQKIDQAKSQFSSFLS